MTRDEIIQAQTLLRQRLDVLAQADSAFNNAAGSWSPSDIDQAQLRQDEKKKLSAEFTALDKLRVTH